MLHTPYVTPIDCKESRVIQTKLYPPFYLGGSLLIYIYALSARHKSAHVTRPSRDLIAEPPFYAPDRWYVPRALTL